jgi:parallel beta-helix repeat protein
VLKDDLNVRAPNQTITHCSITGYVEIFSSYNELTGNAIDNEIRFEGSHCTFYGNSFYRILMENSNSNEIHNNTCSGISLGIYGKDCSNNTVSGNLLNGGHIWGILMGCGSGNIFYGNHITNFGGTYSGYGVAIGGNYVVAENNTFYHNTFLNNNKNVGYNWELEGSGNFWDNGIEGNYWDDYTGTDTNGDGIGDTPYIIDENNQDNFPLMEPAEMSTIPEFQSWIFLVGGLFAVTVASIICKPMIKERKKK